ncbi:T9SS type A sorting domain-containing protein [Corallibacter sp.]|uniref:T9SS type A sorting domain-containing protein n=1 Tax=Corallibacter sp. TaxID=2038084 RepID=UPI003A9537D5
MKKTTYFIAIFIAFQTLMFAQVTSIPDANFEQELVNLGIDSDATVNGQILTADAASRTSFIDLSGLGIADMTGIEAFVNLTALKSSGNTFTTIDLTSNLALNDLNLSDSDISTLDLSGNVNLTKLNVSYSLNLTTLDLTSNVLLADLNTEECNNITSINITGLTTLVDVNVKDNDLSSFDVSANLGLETINVRQNQLTSLDLSSNGALTEINVGGNGMTSLDLRNGNNVNVTSFIGTFNSDLKCVFVDDPNAAYLTNVAVWEKDGNSNFVANQIECDNLTLNINEIDFSTFSLYPNPAKNTLNINVTLATATIEIYNITGRKVLSKPLTFGDNSLNISSLQSGVYITRVSSSTSTETKKLIVK